MISGFEPSPFPFEMAVANVMGKEAGQERNHISNNGHAT